MNVVSKIHNSEQLLVIKLLMNYMQSNIIFKEKVMKHYISKDIIFLKEIVQQLHHLNQF